MENTLYYGNNLDILKRYIPDESIDLVYLDPPFKSSQNYNILFKEKNGSQAASQIRAFEDTWTWSQEDEAIYADLVTRGGKVADCLQAFRTFLGPCDMLAYLIMMAPRLVELRRVMKPTASIYLHCDPAASHYLKLLMDAIFGPQNFLNEIIWKRTSAHSTANKYGCNADHILFYGKTEGYFWEGGFTKFDEKFLKRFKRKDSDGRLWYDDNITGAGTTEGESGQDWRGFSVRALGRHWRTTHSELDRWTAEGLIYFPPGGGFPRLKRYLDEGKGVPLQSIWTDISPINSQAAERLGYPTQKPEALLERIIQASSNKGDIVLDPFCGCGTTVAAAQKLRRHWIGIDITFLAITLIKQRMRDAFGNQVQFKVVGEPVSVPDARALAESEPYQFQWWALDLVGARPVEEKKGADKGIDGKIIFQGEEPGKFETVIISVKAGNLMAHYIRDLRGVVDREKAAIGVLISMEDPTKPMRTEAVTAGFFETRHWGKFPKIQLLTIAELLAKKKIDMPPIRQVDKTFKKAEKFRGMDGEQSEIKEPGD